MTGLLTPPLRSGVYELPDDVTLPERLRRAGWHVGQTDLTDPREAVAAVGDELGFPDYYGKNLDALNDSLSDLDRPTALIVRAPAHLDRYGLAMIEVLTDRAESVRGVPFALVRVPTTPSS